MPSPQRDPGAVPSGRVGSPGGLGRRAALGALAAAAAGLASGCTVRGIDRRSPATASAAPSAAGAAPSARPRRAPENADVALAAATLHDEQAMVERLRTTARRHPRLARTLGPSQVVHQRHVRLLSGAVPEQRPTSGARRRRPARVPRRPGRALAALVRAEDDLSRRGRRGAAAALSGPFARVLASMAAAAAQQSLRLGRAGADG